MSKKPPIQTIATGYYSRQALNNNFEELRDAFDNTLSIDGSGPNAMQADLDMDGNAVLNASAFVVNGQDVVSTTATALAAANTANATAQGSVAVAQSAAADAQAAQTASESAAIDATLSANAASNSKLGADQAALLAQAFEGQAQAAQVAAEAAETNATSSASNASASATAALSSANAASTSATASQVASDAALAALDDFDVRYLGQKASDPTVNNTGGALVGGNLYFNTVSISMRVYDGFSWVPVASDVTGVLQKAHNLGDLLDVAQARSNLGLSTVATTGAYSDLTGTPASYSDAKVDTHLNTATAIAGEYLSWNGSDYDWATVPAGYSNSDVDAHLNRGTATADQVLAWTGADYDWVDASAGATGGGTDKIFVENGQVVTTNYTVSATTNAMTTGPIDINAGVTVTVETGGRWVVI